jgi:glycerate kinase
MEATKLRDRLIGADLCLTGEGKLDAQSLAGKTAVSVAQLCKELNVPCIALAGALSPGHERAHEEGLTAAFPICDAPMTLDESMRNAATLITTTTARLLRTFTARVTRPG